MSATTRRILGFAAIFGALYFALAALWSDTLSHWVIDEGTVRPAAWLARLITGDSSIVAAGSQLRAPDGAVNVLYGCEGTDVLMLLLSAILAAPASWRRRLAGLLLGTVVVFALNQARVLALFYALRKQPDWFGPVHGLIGPVVVVVAVSAFFLAWLQLPESPAPANGTSA